MISLFEYSMVNRDQVDRLPIGKVLRLEMFDGLKFVCVYEMSNFGETSGVRIVIDSTGILYSEGDHMIK